MQESEQSSSSDEKSLRRLLPKSEGTNDKSTTKLARNPISGCFVSICPRPKCTLSSHHQPPRWMLATRANKTTDRMTSRVALSRKFITVPECVDPRVDDKEFKNLFHQYLTFDMPRIVALMAPPSLILSPDEDIKAKAQGVATLGVVAPVYYLLFVSMAHILELARREQLEPDRISAKLYGRLMQMVREKLDEYKPSEASDLVLSVLALCSFDMTLRRTAAVEHHRSALERLVAQAGFQSLGRSMAYVLSWDRLIAAFTAKPPLYGRMPDRSLLRAPSHLIRYGLGFDMAEDALDLDVDVRNLCFDVCRAIEIVEAEDWSFRPDRLYKSYSSADVQYLYFLRDVIQNTCTVLQARSLHNSPKSRPVFFAAMIIQYLVLGKNDLPWYSAATADRLLATLTEQDLDLVWRGSEDVLCWLMCLLMIVPKPWTGRAATAKLFGNWLSSYYSSYEIPSEMNARGGLCNHEDFVWHKPDFDDQLSTALTEIEVHIPGVDISHIRKSSFAGSEIAMLSWSFATGSSADGGSESSERT